jgi:Thioredoxin-like domain
MVCKALLALLFASCWLRSVAQKKSESRISDILQQVSAVELGSLQQLSDASLVVFHSFSATSKSKALGFFNKLPSLLKTYLGGIKLWSFNCLSNSEVCAEQGIETYPTLMLFANGNKFVYKTPYRATRLQSWLNEHLFIKSKELKTAKGLESILNTLKTREDLSIVFFCGDISHPLFRPFERLSKKRNEKYLFSDSPEVFGRLNCTAGDILYIDRTQIAKNKLHTDKPFSILRFIFAHRYKHVRLLNLFHHREFFSDHKPMIILLSKTRDEEEHLQILERIASKVKDTENFFYIYETSHNKALVKNIDRLLGIEAEDKPCIRYVKVKNHNIIKYQMNQEITSSNINRFLRAVRSGKVTPYTRSQPVKKHHKYFQVFSSYLETRWQQLREVLHESDQHCLYFFLQKLRLLSQVQRGSSPFISPSSASSC